MKTNQLFSPPFNDQRIGQLAPFNLLFTVSKFLNQDHRDSARSRGISRSALALLLAAGIGLLPATSTLAGPPYQVQVVTYLGAPAPGGGTFANDFEPTALNNRGELAFTAEPDLAGEEAIFVADSSGLSQIVRYGQQAPGGGFFGRSERGILGLNDAGDLAFAFDRGTGQNIFRWLQADQTLSAVIVPGVTPVPENSGVFVGAFGDTSINNRGEIALMGNITNPPPASFKAIPYRTGVFVADRFGGLTTVAKPGDPAPGGGTFISAGAMYALAYGFIFFALPIGPSINDGGDVAFGGQVVTGTNAFNNSFNLYVRRFATGAIEAIPPAPGYATGVVSSITINARREVAFYESSNPGSFAFTAGLPEKACVSSGGNTAIIVAVGDAAPGGGHFTTLGSQLRFNNRGDLAFVAQTSTHDEAVYLYVGATGKLRRIAGIATSIPGFGVIANLHDRFRLLLGDTALNDLGQITFVANVTEGNTTRLALLVATPGDEQLGIGNGEGNTATTINQ